MANIEKNCRSCKHFNLGCCNIMVNRITAYKEDHYWPHELSKLMIDNIKENVKAIIEPSEFSCSNWE